MPVGSKITDTPHVLRFRNVKHDNARRAISKDRQITGDGDVLSSARRSVDSGLNGGRGVGNIDDLQPRGTSVHRCCDVSG